MAFDNEQAEQLEQEPPVIKTKETDILNIEKRNPNGYSEAWLTFIQFADMTSCEIHSNPFSELSHVVQYLQPGDHVRVTYQETSEKEMNTDYDLLLSRAQETIDAKIYPELQERYMATMAYLRSPEGRAAILAHNKFIFRDNVLRIEKILREGEEPIPEFYPVTEEFTTAIFTGLFDLDNEVSIELSPIDVEIKKPALAIESTGTRYIIPRSKLPKGLTPGMLVKLHFSRISPKDQGMTFEAWLESMGLSIAYFKEMDAMFGEDDPDISFLDGEIERYRHGYWDLDNIEIMEE